MIVVFMTIGAAPHVPLRIRRARTRNDTIGG
jgi:hypothetical protein